MGDFRNGARTTLNLLGKICRLSRLPGFRAGIGHILGATVAADFFIVFDPLCSLVDTLIAADNWYNQFDYHPDASGNEDQVPV